ncbi:hypothetical protein E2C01_063208 [Portunus trituberculatus]|uniref:Uncharacterized protein n=1 Tax=Portunus trituberculatus TaxID=210409 RepID=A0A5B7HHH6_PORTR|nr:hypothetical protein [Portunus trituberculatus]
MARRCRIVVALLGEISIISVPLEGPGLPPPQRRPCGPRFRVQCDPLPPLAAGGKQSLTSGNTQRRGGFTVSTDGW